MNDHIQAHRPPPPSRPDDQDMAHLRKPQGGIPVWVWVVIGVVLLLPVGCMGAGALFYFLKRAAPSQAVPVVTARTAPLSSPQPDDR